MMASRACASRLYASDLEKNAKRTRVEADFTARRWAARSFDGIVPEGRSACPVFGNLEALYRLSHYTA